MILRGWVQRLLGRACTWCKGNGWTNPSKIVNTERLPCGECLGTGLRLVERSEITSRKRGTPEERRRKWVPRDRTPL